ncbi:hypothetical protein MKJ04_00830 [Pontibacter sp. E15-1]|uniref:hypothetical protein n=1 Tax=Pontibacter sp. E15-1 TaxID=2919918 RepID=UPI001F4F5610|nr:hypothetical protein [Pontibacter sp. E15-1]MCJ8163366.1 hypothetical protein [Pontibacter sp. E15-1]
MKNAIITGATGMAGSRVLQHCLKSDEIAQYRLSRRLYPVLRLLGEKYSIKSTELAAAIFRVGLRGAPYEILENQDILKQLN